MLWTLNFDYEARRIASKRQRHKHGVVEHIILIYSNFHLIWNCQTWNVFFEYEYHYRINFCTPYLVRLRFPANTPIGIICTFSKCYVMSKLATNNADVNILYDDKRCKSGQNQKACDRIKLDGQFPVIHENNCKIHQISLVCNENLQTIAILLLFRENFDFRICQSD